MKPRLRSVGKWGMPDLAAWTPENPETIAEEIWLEIGPQESDSADTFRIRVATPAGLETLQPRLGILAVPPLLVMSRYSHESLMKWLHNTVEACEAETWSECVGKLQRSFGWEFDDYREVDW